MSHNLYSCGLTQAKNGKEQRSAQKFLAINEVSHQGAQFVGWGERVVGVGFLLLPMYSIKFSQCSSTSQCVRSHIMFPITPHFIPYPLALSSPLVTYITSTQGEDYHLSILGMSKAYNFFCGSPIKDIHHKFF